MDKDLITAKASSVAKHLDRVKKKSDGELADFIGDLDRQESILFNLQMAIQNCIDIAAHIISEAGLGVPGSTNEMFYMLEEKGYLTTDLTEKMVSAVGFRNLMVHEYARLELERVFEVARKDAEDLNTFIASILKKI